jgi:two-component sensor histidine kinase
MDPRTATILMLITSVECSLLFFASGLIRRGKAHWNYSPSLFWGLGTAVYVVGLTALLTQGRTTPWFGVIFSNAFLSLGLVLIIVGLRKLARRDLALTRFAFSWLAYLVLSIAFTFLFQSTSARIILFSCFIAALYIEGAVVLWMARSKASNTLAPMLALAFILLAAFFIFRAVVTTIVPQASIFSRNAINVATFVVSQFGLIAWSLGLILLQNRLMERDLERAYEEKEVLLSELQHRVKNSMAVISGLVSLESNRVETKGMTSILDNLKGRIDAISALYDRLFRSGETGEIDLDAYLRDVAASLVEGLAAESRGISMELDMESVRLDAKRAGALGIIVNELLTDSFKHAFPDGRVGKISLSLKRDQDQLVLVLADDGVGLPQDFNVATSSGLGMVLVDMLSAQIGGTFAASSAGGARFVLRFSQDSGLRNLRDTEN